MGEYQCFTPAGCDAPMEQRGESVQIKCRSYGGITIPEGTEIGETFSLVNLTVDTRNYKKPCVKLDFLSNILTDTATATLNFQVFRQCKGEFAPVPVSAVWTFSRTVATDAEANSFGFSLCDCDNCNCGCCNYSVVATVAGAATTGTVTVNNATLIAMVAEDANC